MAARRDEMGDQAFSPYTTNLKIKLETKHSVPIQPI